MADYGASDTSTTSLGTNQFPISEVYVTTGSLTPASGGSLTALQGGPATTDGSSPTPKRSAPVSVYAFDGNDVTQGATTDNAVTGDTAGTISAKLRGLNKILNDIWDSTNHRFKVDGSGVIQPVSQSGAWSVTANIGTTNGLALDATVGKLNVAQGATLGTSTGPMVQASVSSSAPSYTTGQISPLSLTPAGALRVDGSAVTQPVSGTFWQATQPISAASLPLPTGAATSAKQPALGTAGSASTDVLTVQGIASMTPLKVDGSGVTQPVSGTITVQQATGSNLHTVVDSGAITATTNADVAPEATAAPSKLLAIAGLTNDATPAYEEIPLGADGRSVIIEGYAGGTAVPVSGTFWQATQPVSGTVTANAGTGTFNIQSNASVNLNQVAGSAVATAATGIAKVGVTDGSGNAITSTSNALDVNIKSGGGSGFSVADEAAWTAGTSAFVPAGGVFNDTATALTAGQEGTFRSTNNRALHTNIRNASGTELATSSNPLRIDPTGTTTQPVSIASLPALPANQSVNIAQVAGGNTANAGQTGAMQVGGAVATNTVVSSATNPLLIAGSDYGGTPKVQTWKVDGSGNGQVAITNTPTVTANAGSGTFTIQSNASVNVNQVAGSAVSTAAAGTQLVGIADGAGNALTSNSTTYTAKKALDANLLGTLGTAFSTAGKVDVKGADGDVFVRQATASNLNATVVGTGTFAVQAAQSGNWTSRIVGNAGGVMDAAGQNAASPANELLIAGQFNTTPTTITSGNVSPLQLDSAANLLVNLKTAIPAGGNTIGAVTQASGPWSQNITQFGSSNVVTGTGAGGSGVPRVTVSSDSQVQVWDGTTGPVAVKGANAVPTLADKSHVHSLSPNNTGLPVNLPKPFNISSNKSSGSVASLAQAFSSANTAGNSIIVACAVGNGTAPTISDTNSNTYTQIAQVANGTAFNTAIFLATNIVGGSNTVTVNNGGSTASIAMTIYEVPGLLASIPNQPDQYQNATGTSGTASTSALTPASSNEYAFAAIGVGTAAQTITPATGWTNDSGQQNPTTPAGLFSFVAMSQLLGSITPLTPQATFTSEPWAMAAATFRPVILGIEGSVLVSSPLATSYYGTNAANGTLTNAANVVATQSGVATVAGVTSTSTASNNYAEIYGLGGAPASATSIGTPTGHGWAYGPGVATAYQAATWLGIFQMQTSGPGSDTTYLLRMYKYSGGTYTFLGAGTAQSYTGNLSQYIYQIPDVAAFSLGASDILYWDLWEYDHSGAGGDAITMYMSGTSTAGVQGLTQFVYIPSTSRITIGGVEAPIPVTIQQPLIVQPGNSPNSLPWLMTVTSWNNTGSVDTNSGTKSAGTLRVVLATDQPTMTNAQPVSQSGTWTVGANSATGSAVPANAFYEGGLAKTALPSAASDGNLTGAMLDKFGRQVVLPGTIRDLRITQTTTISNSTSETTIVTAVASVFLDVVMFIFSNTSGTATRIDIRDTTAGTVLGSVYVPAGDMRGFAVPGETIPQTSVNSNWTATCATAVTDIRVYALVNKNK